MLNKEDLELIESYLEGKLSWEQKAEFEARLAMDLSFAEEFEEHKLFLSTLYKVRERKNLKATLNKIHDEEIESNEQNVVFMPSSTYKINSFFKRHFPTMAVAASVALITVFCSFMIMDYLKSLENKQLGFYQELRKEVDKIKKNQSRIRVASEKPTQVHTVKFSGTAFAVASNGFLVTNYHLVKDSDSLFVETKSGTSTRYKVIVVANDIANDISLLKIVDQSFLGFTKIPYAFKGSDSDLGEPVFTLAFPREDMVYGEGSISSRSGFEGDTTSYQISVPVNPGNSGGPLLDEKGNLIGIITGKNTKADGAAFAIKSRYLLDLFMNLPDSLNKKVEIPSKNHFKSLRRSDQIKQMQDLVFNLKIYND
jgi:serine protease Do